MSFGAWLTDVQKATENLTNSFLSERKTTPKRSRSSDASSGGDPPFGEAECEWLQASIGGAVQASSTHFGKAVHERFTQVEGSVEMLKAQNHVLQAKLEALDAKVESNGNTAEVQAQLEELRTQMRDLPQTQAQPAASSTAPNNPSTHAVLGCLGFDDNEQTVVTRAKELLGSVGMHEDTDWQHMAAMREKGSMAECFFTCPLKLAMAKTAIRVKKTSWVQGKQAWLDVKKTKEQRKPATTVHRMHRILTEFEETKTPKGVITKDLRLKVIRRNGVDIGKIEFGRWRWMPEAMTTYSADERNHATEWATSD